MSFEAKTQTALLTSLAVLATFITTVVLLGGCKENSFSASSGKNETTRQGSGSGEKNHRAGKHGAGDDATNTGRGSEGRRDMGEGDLVSDLDEENAGVQKPVACNSSNIKFIGGGSSETSCPKNYAAFSADDARSPRFGCCPLPARDILSGDPPATRLNNCAADEIVTGVSGNSLSCTRINTKRYRLGSTTPTCYNGSGASGGDGAASCGAPTATLQALVQPFGSDACLGFPWGSLMVRWSGKECRDVSAAQVFYVDSGAPVQVFATE